MRWGADVAGGRQMIETGVTMKTLFRRASPALFSALGMALAVAPVVPQVAHAQAAGETTEARLRRLEAEIRALQRKVFPDGAGRAFGPEITPTAPAPTPAVPSVATTPLTDVLSRLDAVEAQLRQVTAATEENQNHLSKLDTRVSALETAAAPPAAATDPAGANPSGIAPAAGAGGGLAPRPAAGPAQPPAKAPAAAPASAKASADRVAAVAAIEMPSTGDKQADEYTYGYRLYDAKFYPEAQVQLNKFVTAYPKAKQISLARNLLGRAYLEDGKPGTAAQWFLQNYLGDKKGERAPDSLLYLGVAMTRINDTKRACGAFAELRDAYPDQIAGRLKGQYENAIKGVKCD